MLFIRPNLLTPLFVHPFRRAREPGCYEMYDTQSESVNEDACEAEVLGMIKVVLCVERAGAHSPCPCPSPGECDSRIGGEWVSTENAILDVSGRIIGDALATFLRYFEVLCRTSLAPPTIAD